MRYCQYCGARVGEYDQYCPTCGALQVDFRSVRSASSATYANANGGESGLVVSTRMVLQDCLKWSDRLSRQDYWWAQVGLALLCVLLIGAIAFVAVFIDGATDGLVPEGFSAFIGYTVMGIWVCLCAISSCVRRLHDINQSGVLYLINFVPAIGGVILLVLLCLPGTVGRNNYD